LTCVGTTAAAQTGSDCAVTSGYDVDGTRIREQISGSAARVALGDLVEHDAASNLTDLHIYALGRRIATKIVLEERPGLDRGVDVYSHVEAFVSMLPEGRSIYLSALTRVDALVVPTGAPPPSVLSAPRSAGRTPFYSDIRGPLVRDGRILDVPLGRLP
jgi:hypothetical protein